MNSLQVIVRAKEDKQHPLSDDLAAIVGLEYVSDNEAVRWSYLPDWCIIEDVTPVAPAIVVRPRTTEEVSKILRLANRTRTPVYTRSGGVQPQGARGEEMYRSILLDMTRMTDLVELDEKSLTATIQAGATWMKFNLEVEKRGWQLGHKGTYGGFASTVGGGVSVNNNGFGSAVYGMSADEVTNLNVVLPNGDILETGSRVNPNARRFFRFCVGPDLAGIFMSSGGTLGVITEVTMRIYPKKKRKYGTVGFKDGKKAFECYYDWIRNGHVDDMAWTPRVSPGSFPELTEKGYEGKISFMVQDVDEDVLEAKWRALVKTAKEHGGEILDPRYAESWYMYRSEWEGYIPQLRVGLIGRLRRNEPTEEGIHLIGTPCCHMVPVGDAWDHLQKMIELDNKYQEEMKKYNVSFAPGTGAYLGMKNAGHSPTGVGYDQSDPKSVEFAHKLIQEHCKLAVENGGCNYNVGKYWWPHTIMKSPVYRELLIKIKKAVDPNNIMNPGGLGLPSD